MKFYLTYGDLTRLTSPTGVGFTGNIYGDGRGSGGLYEDVCLSLPKPNGDGHGCGYGYGYGNEDGDGDTWKSRADYKDHIHPRVSADPNLRIAIQTAALQLLLHIG